MAPSRPRAAATLDDSRSEASSTREKPGNVHTTASGVTKGRRANATNKHKDLKALANGAGPTVAAAPPSAPLSHAQQDSTLSGISWHTLPTSVLHAYRHAYRLSTPSAHSSQQAQIILSQGLGRQSPTTVFARRKARETAKASTTTTTTTTQSQPSKANGTAATTPTIVTASTTTNGKSKEKDASRQQQQQQQQEQEQLDPSTQSTSSAHSHPHTHHHHHHHICPDSAVVGKVTKPQLALAVRKHFNSMGLSEPDAIARFLYKVREERKGKDLRLRFTA